MRIPTRLDNFDSPGGIPRAWLQAIPRPAKLISEAVTDGEHTYSDRLTATLAGESLNKPRQTGHEGDPAGRDRFLGLRHAVRTTQCESDSDLFDLPASDPRKEKPA
jgi:hypothetical protein